MNRAQAEGSSTEVIVDRYITAYFRDIRRLNILDADEYPRVTEHILAIVDLIRDLEAKGYAYAMDGDVYYNVWKFDEYGKLSGRKLEQIQAGVGGRVDPSDPESKKQDPFDFALWAEQPILEFTFQTKLSDYVSAIAWSPTGNILAAACCRRLKSAQTRVTQTQ